MSDYIAPVKEISFVLNELAGLSQVCELPRFEDSSEDVVDAVLEEAGKFASGVLAPLNSVGDNEGAKCVDNAVQETAGFAEAYQQFVEGGWVALPCNPEFGGMGLPESVGMATMEMWNAANISFGLCPMLGQGAIGAIESHASDALKAIYLEKMVSGEWTGTMNLTEPQAGSDLAVVRSKAIPEGDHYLISGTKIFITWGDHQMTDNVVHLVLARTPDAPEGVKGISLFVVPKFLVNDDGSLGERNDAYAVSVEHKLGIHASPTCVMSFGDNGGAVGYLVGEENKGLAYMFTMMNHARLNVGAQGVAMSDRAYQHAVAYANDRVQGKAAGDKEKGTIIRHPDIRRMLMVMRSMTEASRAVCYVASSSFDMAHHGTDEEQRRLANARGELLTPIAKGWSTEISQEITSLGVQIHGGMGFVEETGAAQYLRDARITTIYEGTTGIQANDLIGRKLIRDQGQEFNRLIDEIRATQAEVAALGDEMATIASSLAQGADSLQQVANWVIEHHMDNPQLPGAVAVNFMMAAGTVIGGWLLAKGAVIATAKLAEDESFYSAKIITARFYAEQIMPRADAHVKMAESGSAMTMALADDQF
ncbi:acyl-CoA dehydrogenase [Oceanicoccus sagamiensis]|uniref:3-methylmercaptopropionyl-CoA dehydrogenase n=1 Tax=Oceanicoccus sagamiensis TaxID=716816 RepID=A0A1X9NIH7_9GAMM|nr:acyl-CoA dehydrogenase [Oceanicoccus sagamiensis]ARN76192.1 acyl-CoA dehydrogenase [Oceanicoccus sagamiensis]